MACQCGRFTVCNPSACSAELRLHRRGSVDWRAGRFGLIPCSPHNEIPPTSTPKILPTQVSDIQCKGIISHNSSPDIPWSKSVNPYLGCEHGCSYCYARPSYSYHQLSPGLDFETRLFAKTNAAAVLQQQLAAPSYRPTTIVLGTNTDVYQPIERKYQLTRAILAVCLEFGQPISILTKNSLIERDIDLLTELAAQQLVEVHFSITTLSEQLAKTLEPRASLPRARLQSINKLSAAGIPVKAMCAPLIPELNMPELQPLMLAAKEAGAQDFAYILLRLPFETQGIFADWLTQHLPDNKKKILQTLEQYRGSAQHEFSSRMTGTGDAAQALKTHFQTLYHNLGFTPMTPDDLSLESFKYRHYRGQLGLF